MSNHQTIISPLQNSTCRHVGHEWKTGLVQTYRVCTRQHCRAAQRFVHGEWIEAPRPSATRLAHPSFETMVSLWNCRPSSVEPVRDREQERRIHEQERFYYKAVADEAIYRAALTRRQRGAS